MNYLQRLQQSTASKDAGKALMNAREAHLQLTKDALDAEKRNLAAESRLETLKGQFPINTQAILEAQYEAEAASRNFLDLLELGTELFPEGVRTNVSLKEEETPEPSKKTTRRTKPTK
jgi:hypothetical protein